MPLEGPYEIGEPMDKASKHRKAGKNFRDAWKWAEQDKEIYEALEFVLKGKHDQIVDLVEEGEGFELLRTLGRK